MSRMDKDLKVRLSDAGIIAVVRGGTAGRAYDAACTLLEAGIAAVEITYTTPGVPETLRRLRDSFPDSLLGAGTIIDPEQARQAADAGASFLVSPGLDDKVVAAMNLTGTLTMAGALTPTEVMRAQRLRVDVVKLFPGSHGGPSLLRALRGPFPELVCVPTGGVGIDNLSDWFAAGALAVGVGGSLCPAAAVDAGDQQQLRDNTRAFLDALERAR